MAIIGISTLLVALLVFCLYWLIRYLNFRRKINKIPGSRAFFLTGVTHTFHSNPEDWFEQFTGICTMHGNKPRVLRFWLSLAPFVCAYGPEEAEKILSCTEVERLDKSWAYSLLHPWLGQGLVTCVGQKWKPRRKLLMQAFNGEILKDFIEIFNEQAKVLLCKLETNIGEPIDLFPYITLCALDIICQAAMGQPVHAQLNKDNEYVTAVYEANRIVHERQKLPWLWPDFLFRLIGEGKTHDWAMGILHGFTEKVIQERYNQMGNSDVTINNNVTTKSRRRVAFLDLLLKMVERNELPLDDVRDEVDTFMFAGHDTTSTGMNWLLHLLACHPEIQRKVQDELDEVFGDEDRDVRFDDLPKLKYLECCIRESLRLFPSVPVYGRTLYQDLEIGGYTVPAGAQVIVNPYMVHRDPKHWPDPEIFNPDRFLPENAAGRHPYAYVPFSAGSRNCIGQRFGLMEEKTVLSWLLRYFNVSCDERRDQVRPKAELILRPAKGVHSRLTLRRNISFKN